MLRSLSQLPHFLLEMIVKVTRTRNEEEQPIVVGPHCFTNKGTVGNTTKFHVMTIPFGNYVIDKVPCKPPCMNVVPTGPKQKKC